MWGSNLDSASVGTIGGTALVWISIDPGDVQRTIILAVIGATVSFAISHSLRQLVRSLRR